MSDLTLNILHLPNTEYSHIRYNNFMKQLMEQEITNFRIWPGIFDKYMPWRGISRGHKQIIQDAKANSLPYVCIMEDDVVFFGKGAFEFYVNNIPSDYDIYLGSLSNGLPDANNELKDFRGMSLYMIHARFYDTFLELSEKMDVDAALSGKGKYYVCPQIVCYQKDGYSYRKQMGRQYSKLVNKYRCYVPMEKDISQ